MEAVDPANDSLLGAPSTGLDFFSSPDAAAIDLVFSSAELIDVRGLWALAALVEFAVGFLSVEPPVGRDGGLLRVVPVVGLAVGAEGVFKTEDVEGFVELAKVRFGIVPALGFGGGGFDSTEGGCSTV